jgi:glycosyltransferase involved in cell wall biosynthesis
MTKPRLLYVSTVDTVVRMMLPHLDAARTTGFTVEVACRITRHGHDVRAHSDRVHDVPLRRFPLHPGNLLALLRLVRLMRARGYTVVHAHTPAGGVIGRLAATIAGVPVRAYTAHGFHFHRHGGRVANALYRAIETIAGHRLSDAVLVINGEDYEAALRGRVVPPDRLFLTDGVGVSTEQFDPARVSPAERRRVRREIDAPDDAVPVLTCVGEMIPRKRHGDALQAFAEIRRAYPDAVLLLAGDGKLEQDLKARARALGVWEYCRFLGFRRDIARLLAATDVFLFPSVQEGLPCSVQEALCMEVPVVATEVRGNCELVDPSCGRLVPLGDTRALAAATVELLGLGPEERRRLGAAGRAKMIRRYERSVCVAQWLDIYATLLARKGLVMPRPTVNA